MLGVLATRNNLIGLKMPGCLNVFLNFDRAYIYTHTYIVTHTYSHIKMQLIPEEKFVIQQLSVIAAVKEEINRL